MMYRYKSIYRILFVISFIIMTALPLAGQKHKKYTRQGNRDYTENQFEESEMLYRRAIDAEPSFKKAIFNLGDALYKQEKYDAAIENFSELTKKELKKKELARSQYNLGNSLLKAGRLEESIEAYKDALRNDPGNKEAKYNLAYAMDQLEKQQQDKNDEQQQDQNDEQQQDQQQDQNDEQQQMTKEDAERLLQALAEDEKEIQEKVKEAKAAKARVRTLKNW